MISLTDVTLEQPPFRLAGITFDIPAGHYAVLMGQTGSGKTTLLEAIAGLRPVRSGRIRLGGRDVTNLPPHARAVGYVPQDGALFQTMTVFDNLAFALRVQAASNQEVRARVEELAGWLEIEHLLRRLPRGLSGGETQRVALGRALAFRPPVLLMDEPLSALDESTRDRLIEVLRTLRTRGEITVLHVTHNRQEAAQLGNFMLRIDAGQVTTAHNPLPAPTAFSPLPLGERGRG